MPFENTSEAEVPANIPSVHVRRSVVDGMLQASLAKELRTVERDIDRDLKPHTTSADRLDCDDRSIGRTQDG
jgi:hypothetical protein